MNVHIENAVEEMPGVLSHDEFRHMDEAVAQSAEKILEAVAGLNYIQAVLAMKTALQAARTAAILPRAS